jgi:glutamate--cysteine ligase
LGKPNGFQSYRSHIWQHTDKDRCGMLPFVFEEGMGFERYVDYALDVPMYFVRRDKQYINVAGRSFRHFLKGELRELPGQKPTPQDWQDHLTTLFPEVRLKNVLELRGMDSGPCPQPSAMAALWTGLLYDDEALAQCTDFIASWNQGDMNALYEDLPKEGLDARIDKMSLYDVAKIILPWARQGHLRQEENTLGAPQTPPDYLAPLVKIVETKRTPADCLLDLYHQSGSVTNFLEKIALSNPII